MPDDKKKLADPEKEKAKVLGRNKPTFKELTREELETLRRKLQEKFH